uniref:Lipoprotein n=1 Tax=viral metagenome TaxID=1070528 RepID=A0A6M3L3Z2_9ZZZZ
MKTIIIILCLSLAGCAGAVKDIGKDYAAASKELKQFAKITSADWLFGSGIIRGAIPEDALPKWVVSELDKIDAWFEAHTSLTDKQLGYILGVRIRMAAPVIKAAIQQYAPGILSIAEVATVLAFIGL